MRAGEKLGCIGVICENRTGGVLTYVEERKRSKDANAPRYTAANTRKRAGEKLGCIGVICENRTGGVLTYVEERKRRKGRQGAEIFAG